MTNCSSYPTPANTYKLISGKHCLKISIHCSTFPWQKGSLFKSSSPQRLVTNPLVLSFLCLWLYTCYSAFLLHWIYQWPGAAVWIRPLSLLPLNSCSQPSCLTQKVAGSARPALFKVTSTSTSLGTSGGHTAKLRKSDIQCQHIPCLPISTSLQTLAAWGQKGKIWLQRNCLCWKRLRPHIFEVQVLDSWLYKQALKVLSLALGKIYFSFISLLPSVELGFWWIAASQFVGIYFIQF